MGAQSKALAFGSMLLHKLLYPVGNEVAVRTRTDSGDQITATAKWRYTVPGSSGGRTATTTRVDAQIGFGPRGQPRR